MTKIHRTKKKDNLIDYIKVALSSSGFQKREYDLNKTSLYFKPGTMMDRVKKDKLVNTLAQAFPQYSFVWETSYLLTWF